MTAVDTHSPTARSREIAHFEMYSLRSDSEVHWRLLSANNRDSGQSGSGYPDVEACRGAIGTLLGLLAVLRPSYTLTSDHRWHWTLAHSDEVLARSSRSFDRRLRCVAASQWFLQAAPSATVRTTLRVARAPLPDATVAIRRPFTPGPNQLHRPPLAFPKTTTSGLNGGASAGDREGG
jgi:hypothetical protein